MRVVANLTWLTPDAVGGSEEYTTRLLAAVAALSPPDVAVSIVAQSSLVDRHPELAALEVRDVGGPFRGPVHRLLVESTRARALCDGADVVHHFGGRLPARRIGPSVLTIHDLQPLVVPGNFARAKAAYLRAALPRSAAGAELVCTPSAWVAGTVVEYLGVPEEKLRVVPSTWGPLPAGPVDAALLAALGPGPVVVFPAMTHPHKNHLVLLAAADRLRSDHPDLRVVLTGGAGRAEDAVAAAAAAARVDVLRPGRVSAATLAALVARADVVAFPSRYEGFGLPVLEAMRAGTPVVAADATALPEVVGDAGVLVAPDDLDGWVAALQRVLGDEQERARLSALGRRRAQRHSPAAAGARLLEVWRELR